MFFKTVCVHKYLLIGDNNQETKFPLTNMNINDISLCLKIKKWTRFLRKDETLCQLVFGDQVVGVHQVPDTTGTRSEEHWSNMLSQPDTPVTLWHEGRKFR